MVDVGFRGTGTFGQGVRKEEPTVAPPPREPVAPSLTPAASHPGPDTPVMVTPPPLRNGAFFGGDRGGGSDAFGLEPTFGQIAELAAHGSVATPLTIGFLGGPGSGKSFALGRTRAVISDLAAAAATRRGSPFLSRIHVQSVDAAALEDDVGSSLAACLLAGLRQPYPALAREIAHTARDPHVVLREVNEKLDDARRRLDSERRALDDAGSRRARLTETVLFEAAGSHVDAYARANRAGIENRLAAFGVAGEPVRSYKEFVQYVAGSGGKLGLAMRSLWAYKGQLKLIVAAIVLVACGVALGIALDDQSSWLGQLRAGPQAGVGLANWFAGHMTLLSTARSAAFALAALAILVNLWRAFAFVTPIFKGARLLASDLETRRRDLDGLYAHQTKRVDTLDDDVARLTSEVAEAERRAGGSDPATRHEPSPFPASPAVQAQTMFAVLASAMANDKAAPQRIVLAVDHLDAVAPARAQAILDSVYRIAGPGVVTLAAADPARLDPDGSRRGELMRWIEVPVHLDADAASRDNGALVARVLGKSASAPPGKPDGATSALDHPLDDHEVALLTRLASLAGASPRTVKRFVALYMLGRIDGDIHRGALAMMLALAQGGSGADKAAMADALASADPTRSDVFALPETAGPRLRDAFAGAEEIEGRFGAGEALAAARRAARFSFPDSDNQPATSARAPATRRPVAAT